MGHDNITSIILSKVADKLGPHIMHLINRSIYMITYSNILKISKIYPNLKPNKDPHDIDSYRPLNNLSVIDKIFSEHIKIHLLSFLQDNNIIDHNNHGGCVRHSTMTAIINIYDRPGIIFFC